jgi:catechol 2,3-dioxygenase-like lactoylglutathione lyase family enzyme
MMAIDALDRLWPTLFQQAFVVADMAAAKAFFEAHAGVPGWLEMPEVPMEDCRVRGQPAPHTLHLAFGYCGDTQIELVRPVAGGGPAAEFLAARGGGPHHLGYLIDSADLRDEVVAAFARRGLPVLMEGSVGAMTYTYVDTRPLVTEIVTDVDGTVRGMFDALRRGELP